MGQTSSSSSSSSGSQEFIIPETVSVIQEEVIRQARVITEIATLTYEDFQLCLEQLNELSRKITDHNGKKLLFAVKKGTDSTVLWKGTVKIACVKIDPETKAIESHRLFNLNQFLKIFKTLQCHLTAALQSSEKEMKESLINDENHAEEESNGIGSKSSDSASLDSDDSSYHESVSDNSSSISEVNTEKKSSKEEPASTSQSAESYEKRSCDVKLKKAQLKKFTASMLLEEVDNLANSFSNSPDKLGECCICFDRKPDVMLPCAHAYCMTCIEQWNTWHKTCPFCRETLDNTNDTWVISDIPGSQEISDEICSALMNLTFPE